ncbi:cache domain-containing protein [Aromatoleum buckelii]|uniref:Single Cache domain-containing protein n=1 Tax=Aromatoleum buckelii TaxID=200254 RepID=A0ABX1N0L4_9RHOO|nr:cache domain-containing protein [Aromatoleum buckelii]MCK0513011.1 cache domain-containing protein [Aromatoleum buckelii]
MFTRIRIVRALVLGGFALWAGTALPQDVGRARADGPRIVTAAEKRAAVLLERAVRHVQAHGEAGVQAFAREEQFVDRDLYAYALRTDGRFLASCGFSAALVGTNVLDYTDAEGKPFFHEIVRLAKEQGGGRVEYKWFNPADSRGEPKVTLFRKVGGLIVAVGYFSPRATPADAKAMVDAAAKAVKADEAIAFAAFQRIDGRFVRDDLYVFAVDLRSRRFVAYAAQPGLVGTDSHRLVDPTRRHIVSEMIAQLGQSTSGKLDYKWLNPVSGKIESKRSYIRRVGETMVGVGYYKR